MSPHPPQTVLEKVWYFFWTVIWRLLQIECQNYILAFYIRNNFSTEIGLIIGLPCLSLSPILMLLEMNWILKFSAQFWISFSRILESCEKILAYSVSLSSTQCLSPLYFCLVVWCTNNLNMLRGFSLQSGLVDFSLFLVADSIIFSCFEVSFCPFFTLIPISPCFMVAFLNRS